MKWCNLFCLESKYSITVHPSVYAVIMHYLLIAVLAFSPLISVHLRFPLTHMTSDLSTYFGFVIFFIFVVIDHYFINRLRRILKPINTDAPFTILLNADNHSITVSNGSEFAIHHCRISIFGVKLCYEKNSIGKKNRKSVFIWRDSLTVKDYSRLSFFIKQWHDRKRWSTEK